VRFFHIYDSCLADIFVADINFVADYFVADD
jgi:hypothetical protein